MTNIFKSKKALIALVIVTHVAAYLWGGIINRQQMLSAMKTEYERALAMEGLGIYTIYRDIARDIKSKRYDRAECSANRVASGRYDQLQDCLASSTCKSAIETRVEQSAPELATQTPMQFTCLEKKDEILQCQ